MDFHLAELYDNRFKIKKKVNYTKFSQSTHAKMYSLQR